MIKLAESRNYIITSEYETVNLEIKNRNQTIIIGDFYGDPCVALISEDETFCLVGGEGIIIYYLQDPFSEYQRNVSSKQWKEWGRDENTIWVENIQQIDSEFIEVTTDSGNNIMLKV